MKCLKCIYEMRGRNNVEFQKMIQEDLSTSVLARKSIDSGVVSCDREI